MNYRIALKVIRSASDAQIRKQLKMPEDAPVTRRDVQNFARTWQDQVANSGNDDARIVIEGAESEVEIIWQ